MFRTVPLPIIRSFSLYTLYMFHPDPARKLSANLYDIYNCCVYSEKLLIMDRGTVRNMQIHSKNKFEKLVHLVAFIIRIGLALLIRLLPSKESAITAFCDISCGSEIYSRGTRRKVITTRISRAEVLIRILAIDRVQRVDVTTREILSHCVTLTHGTLLNYLH